MLAACLLDEEMTVLLSPRGERLQAEFAKRSLRTRDLQVSNQVPVGFDTIADIFAQYALKKQQPLNDLLISLTIGCRSQIAAKIINDLQRTADLPVGFLIKIKVLRALLTIDWDALNALDKTIVELEVEKDTEKAAEPEKIQKDENDITIRFEDLKLNKRLGSGNFADVYLGEWQHQAVAIKTLKHNNAKVNPAMLFNHEVQLMSHTNSVQVVKLLGICVNPPNYSLVMEFMPHGTLKALLEDPNTDLPWAMRLQFATEIARGLAHLHERNIIHRDLKSENILLDQNYHAKISDLGLGYQVGAVNGISENAFVGSPIWMAPETLCSKSPEYSDKSDVHSMGIIFWEIASRQRPWAHVKDIATLAQYKINGRYDSIPDGTPRQLTNVIQQTRLVAPLFRPPAKMIGEYLEDYDNQNDRSLQLSN